MIYKLKPILKHKLWGGHDLPKAFGIDTNDTIGEAWIFSCLNNDNSPIEGTDLTLKDLYDKDPTILGKGNRGKFPILVKLIDAKQDLSIQVHPWFKSEFWYILNKEPSNIFLGFNRDVAMNEFKTAIDSSTLPSLLNRVSVRNADCVFVKPGTIHAIGAGTFLIEVQQSADATYRLYDYNRLDSQGNPRELHITQAWSCIDYKKCDTEVYKSAAKWICQNPHFCVFKLVVHRKEVVQMQDISYNSLTVIDGECTIKLNDQEVSLKKFETAFIPASNDKYTIFGDCTIIASTL